MNAIQEIKETYSLEDFQEIANHGCQSGVCSQHIYYGDTIKFFDTHEDEITEYIKDTLSEPQLLSHTTDSLSPIVWNVKFFDIRIYCLILIDLKHFIPVNVTGIKVIMDVQL